MAKGNRFTGHSKDEVCEMQKAEIVLNAIQERGKKRLPLERLYRQLFNMDLYLQAYGKLYANEGALTPGTTNQTVDGMSLERIEAIIAQLWEERYQWQPARRTYIPKRSNGKRPLGMPTWEDKLLQEVMRMLLEAYYEPQFSDNSHGFRPGRGCHTALMQIKRTCRGTIWFIEGDISACFDSFDHEVLLSILKRNIHDGRFIELVRRLLKAGYMEDWKWEETLSGTPQGGIISPLLANIYLNELDNFVDEWLIPENTKGEKRGRNPDYRHYEYKRRVAKDNGDRKAYKAYGRKLQSMPRMDTHDPFYRRLRYVRYADDFILAFAGPKHEAERLKAQVSEYLREILKLQMSEEKTLITNGRSKAASFLNYDIKIGQQDSWRDSAGRRNLNGEPILRMPGERLTQFCGRYMQKGKAIHTSWLVHLSDYDIVMHYNVAYRGYVQYYQLASNLYQMSKLRWIMSTSMLKALANKHKSSVQKMADKYRCVIQTPEGKKKGFEVVVSREGKNPLIARFGGVPLKTNKAAKIVDGVTHTRTNRSGLVQRLLADECELCGSHSDIEVHHVRKLADLDKPGRKRKPAWKKLMAAMHRKTLVVCKPCHTAIHNGQHREIWNSKLESRVR